jgi:GT2 family glycosyltransferase/exopolysaccharide biosynthesis predicted pyruvyltransferase EpsI
MQPATQPHTLCDLSLRPVTMEPFPFVTHPQFIQPAAYEQLRATFPECQPSTGPTGFSLYWGDEEYQRLLAEHSVWQDLFNTFHSQAFVDWVRELFAQHWERMGCRLDLSAARYVPYREDRVDKELRHLRQLEHDPNELWVRMDIHQGRKSYGRIPHLDHRRRLISMLIYLCDHTENQIKGGELFLHAASPPQLGETLRITPRHNAMVLFPCMPTSYHSVSEITSYAVPRNYLQVHISSSVDLWAREMPQPSDKPARLWCGYNEPVETAFDLDLETSRAKLLKAIAGAEDIVVVRNYGNIGDQLIHAGLRKLLAGVRYREVSLLELEGVSGELAILTGGGAWCAAHQHMPDYLPRIEAQFDRVVVFPSSFDVSLEKVRTALAQTKAHVFARERVSYEQIRRLCHADFAYDTAFFFDFSPYACVGEGTLSTFRTDAEAAGPPPPPDNVDLALKAESLDEFLWTIARHETVETDRAHVMIAAALLGKRVHYDKSNYHKVPALAECLRDYAVTPLAETRLKQFKGALLQQARHFEQTLPADFIAAQANRPVTIVILSHHRLDQTTRAIRALQEHVKIPFKLRLFDNGSDPETQRALSALSAADERISLTLSPQNLGCVGGRAAELAKVDTEYVFLLDNDVEIFPGALEHLLYQLETHPHAAAATGKVFFPDGSLHLCGADYRIENDVLYFDLLGNGQGLAASDGPSGRCDWVPGCLTLFRTSFFHRQPYDVSLRYYYEDLEWCYRINLAESPLFLRCCEALAIHYHEPKLPQAGLPLEQQRERFMPFLEMIARFYQKHGSLLQTLENCIPELGSLKDESHRLAGKILLELLTARGNEWFLAQWNQGAFVPLFAPSRQVQSVPGPDLELQHAHAKLVAAFGTQQQQLETLSMQAATSRLELETFKQSKLFKLIQAYWQLRRRLRH